MSTETTTLPEPLRHLLSKGREELAAERKQAREYAEAQKTREMEALLTNWINAVNVVRADLGEPLSAYASFERPADWSADSRVLDITIALPGCTAVLASYDRCCDMPWRRCSWQLPRESRQWAWRVTLWEWNGHRVDESDESAFTDDLAHALALAEEAEVERQRLVREHPEEVPF